METELILALVLASFGCGWYANKLFLLRRIEKLLYGIEDKGGDSPELWELLRKETRL